MIANVRPTVATKPVVKVAAKSAASAKVASTAPAKQAPKAADAKGVVTWKSGLSTLVSFGSFMGTVRLLGAFTRLSNPFVAMAIGAVTAGATVLGFNKLWDHFSSK